ncbi:alpha-glucosidase [Parashewanella spongiae]|uniref:Alpha-glucosidase n=1 Tax=Parashewanella spongiae TaxID=342950 RepID=A0A3A6TT54_9GAMM|nr:alpha-glucosidase family protein [Parashewanella spongiae]MCL1078694.1 alpha-glucosidase family protein [Parashewanella spongiae]RJY19397.1 alpha-glucosidase [Parashewanella spongiae]
MTNTEIKWWQGAMIYQVYPRSFADSNADGIGDLQGITSKLEYIAGLGVDAIWISPFFKSPMKDFGYDISDYRDIDPLFGNMDDFDELLEKAHNLGLKIMIDQVLSHTSNEHVWFKESRQSRDNDKSDWYVWADANEDGTPPNNWISIFGGVAWQWEPRRQQYYLHNFLSSQPDLNFHNPDVQQAVLDNVEFWLKKGVDGLRLDAINFCFHDKQLRDNPAKPVDKRQGRGFSEDNPYAFQYHYFNNTQPENLSFLEKLRSMMDKYPNTAALGEISSENSLATMAEYTEEGRIHMGYSFELLTEDYSAKYIRETVQTLEAKVTDGWPSWSVSNHDVTRVASRWANSESNPEQCKMITALVASLRGSICFYQGEELGLPESHIPFDQLQDPYGITFWPTFKGRDGCRTPMPWNHKEAFAGFGESTPWLPISDEHKALAVDIQDTDNSSILNSFRSFMAWRKTQLPLICGDIEFIETPEPILIFKRHLNGETVICGFNLSAETVKLDVEMHLALLTHPFKNAASLNEKTITFPPYSVYFGSV